MVTTEMFQKYQDPSKVSCEYDEWLKEMYDNLLAHPNITAGNTEWLK